MNVRGIDWTTDAVFVAVVEVLSDTFSHGGRPVRLWGRDLMPLDQVVNQWSFMKDMIPRYGTGIL